MTTNEFESALKRVLEEKLSLDPGTPPNLAESIRYSLLSGGKRVRPRLVLACSEMLGLPNATALSAAIALEMIHCFTLIHDDLPCMDNDDFRRGLPSNHKVYGEGLALLAGDALVALALEVLSDTAQTVVPLHFQAALKRFCWAIGPRGVIGGQAAEMLLDSKSTLPDLRKMHEGKTGALFAASLLIPADLAGINEGTPKGKAIREFALQLGSAFQIADDLADADQDKGSPISILSYIPSDQARESARTSLERTTRNLEANWGAGACKPLIEIANQVQKSLETVPASK